MAQILKIVQIVLAIALSASILIQARGTGLGGIFGGGGEGNVYRTKRGVEKIIFRSTIVLSILFLTCALLNVLI